MNFRPKSAGGPELHNNWTDLYYILDGEVLHHTGGKLEGGTERNSRIRRIRRREDRRRKESCVSPPATSLRLPQACHIGGKSSLARP